MPPPLKLFCGLTLTLVVSEFITVNAREASAAPGSARQAKAWSPRRCVTDTLSVLRDSTNTTTMDTVAPGITYSCLFDRRGPWLLHVVSIDLRTQRYVLDGERALGAFFGRERVSAMAARIATKSGEPIVGINADFFDLRTGEVENNHVVASEWVKGAVATDSPHDDFDNAHTQFAVDEQGRPLIGRFELHALAIAASRTEPLLGINYRPARREGLVLFTPWYGVATPRDTSGQLAAVARDSSGAPRSIPELRADSARRLAAAATREAHELVLRRLGRRGDTLLFRVEGQATRAGGGTPIPSSGAVLSATGHAREMVDELARTRGVVKVIARLGNWTTPPRAVVGGWPRLVMNGMNVGVFADSLEGTVPGFSSARHPRSAIAFTRDSSTLMLAVVDGRRPWSAGMSLGELADAVIALGGWDAMNLDGGGSSTLWIRGTVVNHPSDAAGERAVGNALFVRRRMR